MWEFHHSEQNLAIWHSFVISVLKAFLEQGDSIFDKGPPIGFGLFVLMGIVVSNAYNYTNVYEMIAPRKPVPYETMGYLVADNFSVYTRLASIEFDLPGTCTERMEAILTGGGSMATLDRNDLITTMISVVAHAIVSVLVGIQMTESYPGNLSITEVLQQSTVVGSGVREASHIHPHTLVLLDSLHGRMQQLVENFTRMTAM